MRLTGQQQVEFPGPAAIMPGGNGASGDGAPGECGDQDRAPQEDRQAAGWMWKAMGQDLARRRKDAGLTQAQFAEQTGRYSRETVSRAERGEGDAAREFWEICDRLLGTGEFFASSYDLIRELRAGRRTAVIRAGDGDLRSSADLRSGELLRAVAGYRRLGWPVKARQGLVKLVTGTIADALEVPRPAGVVAAGLWRQVSGAGAAVGPLSALPVPDASMAVIDAGPRWYFLVKAGDFPWQNEVDTGQQGAEAVIRWHAAGSSVPLPPGAAGKSRDRWAYLPVSVLRLPPPLAVLELLGRATAMTRLPGVLTLPGGALVAPASFRWQSLPAPSREEPSVQDQPSRPCRTAGKAVLEVTPVSRPVIPPANGFCCPVGLR